jgi:hypothetical protein
MKKRIESSSETFVPICETTPRHNVEHSNFQFKIFLISTISDSPQHPLSLFLPAVSSAAVAWQRLVTVKVFLLPTLRSFLRRLAFRTSRQLFLQLNWIAISSQPPLQSSIALFFTNEPPTKSKSKSKSKSHYD